MPVAVTVTSSEKDGFGGVCGVVRYWAVTGLAMKTNSTVAIVISPHISPGFVARAARCRAQRGFRPRGSAGVPSAVRRWGSCAEVKARGGGRCPSIVDDEQRRDRPRPPSAQRVAAAWPRLRCCHSSTMKDIVVVAAPRIRTHGARNGRCWGSQPDLAGRGARTCGTSSTPRRENTSGCCASAPAAGSW